MLSFPELLAFCDLQLLLPMVRSSDSEQSSSEENIQASSSAEMKESHKLTSLWPFAV